MNFLFSKKKGYLEEENLNGTYELFLNECKYLNECKQYLNSGIDFKKTIHGRTLKQYLLTSTHLNFFLLSIFLKQIFFSLKFIQIKFQHLFKRI